MNATTATVSTAAIALAIGTGERTAVEIRNGLRDAPDLSALSAELDGLARDGTVRSRDPEHGRPTLYSLAVPLLLAGDVGQTADLIDREKRRAELAALATAAVLLSRAREDAVTHWRHLGDAGQAVADAIVGNDRSDGLTKVATDAAVVAWLLGRKRTVASARGAGVVDQVLAGLVDPTPAARSTVSAGFARQAVTLVAKLARRAAEKVAAAVAGVKDATASAVRAAVSTAMDAAGVGPRPVARPGQQPPRVWPGSWAVQALLEFFAGVGHRQGTDEVLAVPAVAAALTAYTYVSRRDSVVRPLHKLLDGTTRPTADPLWKRVTPPVWQHNGAIQFNCRCVLVPRFGNVTMTGVPAGV